MPRYQIENTISACILGEYDAEDELQALEAMARDAGYKTYAEACEVAPTREGEIVVTAVS